MKRRLLALCALAALFIVACGSSPSGSSGTQSGATLTVGTGTDADTLDPAAQTTTIVGGMLNMVVEPLVQLNKEGKVVPDLATSWSMSSDGLTYTFDLRQNVHFSDGEPLTAAAVVKSLDRLNSATTFSSQPGTLAVIKSVSAESNSKVQIQLKQVFSPFVGAMTQVTAGILAPNSFNQNGNTIAKVVWPIGTGPYTYTGRVIGEQLSFSRNPSYWGTKPAYAKQVYKVVPDAASREALVRSGQAQVIMTPSPNDLPDMEKSGSGVHVILGPDDRMIGVVINTQDPRVPQLNNPLVRQALNWAINKTQLIDKVQFGAARPLTAPLASSVFGYCDTTGQNSYQYDINKAKQLLAQANATNLTITLASPNGHYANDYEVSQAVAADLEAIGLKVTVPNPPTWPSYVSQINVAPAKATVDLSLLGWAPAYLDASQAYQIFEGSQIPPAGLNTSYWSTAQTDALIEQGQSATDRSTAQSDYCQAAKNVWNAAPWIWLYNPENPIITTTTVKNVYGLPNEQVVTTFAEPASS
jgi:ABC-type transport system substrate-binding protein